MSERLNELGGATAVALATFTSPTAVQTYQARNDLPIPILLDPNRDAYRAFGLGRGSVARVYGWRVVRRYAELARSDGLAGLRRPSEDSLQLGGDFVIASDGTLSYGFWGEGPDDRPSVDELIAAVLAVR